MYFYRTNARRIEGFEQTRIAMEGATNQEVNNYREQVRAALMPMNWKQDKAR